jgi:MFS family permease
MGFRIVGRVLLAQALSSLGTSMSTVALAVMVYAITGSVLQMGGILAASTLPLVLTAWIGGAFLDRYAARNIMVLADAARAILIFAMPFVAREAIGLVYVVAALIGVFTGVFNPGQVKLVADLICRKRLVKVNSYLGVSRDGAELLGYLLGGVVASLAAVNLFGFIVAGYTLAFVLDALSYMTSAILLLGLPQGPKSHASSPRVGTLIAQSPAVLSGLWHHPALRTNLLLASLAASAAMMYVPNSYGLALEVFDKGSLGLATLEVFAAAGLIVGGLLFSRSRLEGDKNRYVFMSLLGASACLIAVSFSDLYWVSITLIAMGGIASVGLFVPSITMFQQIPATAEKGRMIAFRTGCGQLGMAAGFVLGGLVGAELGITQAFLVAGTGAILISLLIYLPYRLRASRRAKMAWSAATEAGASRSTARQIAREAALSGAAVGSGLASTGVVTWGSAAEADLEKTGGDA